MLLKHNQQQSAHPHLAYLDGVRGLAALYVVLHHAYLEVHLSGLFPAFPARLAQALQWLRFGHLSVDVFIVLSGYCLMLPLARDRACGKAADPHFLPTFLVRRCRRILPPYYAACLLSLLMIAAIPALSHAFDARWGVVLPAFKPAVLVSHALLLHNLRSTWIYRIDAPMWSVATEWQIYFVFALILVPLWKRLGVLTSAGVAFVLGIAPHYLLHGLLDTACFHFLGLFGFGMIGACATWPPGKQEDQAVRKFPWEAAGIVALLVTLLWIGTGHFVENWQTDTIVGIAMMFLLVATTQYVTHGQGNLGLRGLVGVLQSRACVRLGTFSYSLYLVHWPILGLTHAMILRLSPSASADVALMLLCGTALSLVFSYLFHLVFERPFMSKPAPKTESEAEAAAIVSPAP